jgi:hypothetical protein
MYLWIFYFLFSLRLKITLNNVYNPDPRSHTAIVYYNYTLIVL